MSTFLSSYNFVQSKQIPDEPEKCPLAIATSLKIT